MKETKMAHTGGGSGSQENIPNEAPTNVFANDGSFLERFKKQMEAMEKESKAANDPKLRKATRTSTEEEERTLDDKKDGEKANEKPEATASLLLSQGKRKVFTGKMGGAGKQLNAKKKKEEKAAASKKDEVEGKPTAWNAYMEEVKRYREMTCAEDVDRVRPLVK